MINTIFEHRSIRKYKSDPIDDAVLNKILEAGIRASTFGNMQVYSMVVTKDEELRKQLLPLHFNQGMVIQAPVHITFCADFNRFNKWCKQRGAEPGYDNFMSLMMASTDALLASQNVALEAEAHGLGICYLGTVLYNAQKFIDLLKLPKGVFPVTAVVLGYPDENPPLTDRLPAEGVVHYETYRDFSEADIDRMYAEKEALPSTQELLKVNELPNLARIFTEKRYTKKDNVAVSEHMLDVAKKQGFWNHD
ncbi:MAG: nitroreductase family protein [Bacteroidota bacterium]